ncbi:hypothetical protein [Fodinibius sp. Rm-B-1B1-1]|uniref:hypothetical protein n=1 Tax=Fodinibius alkaliphilus TaxID=3140241 RepID=UPI00315A5C41
MKDKKFVGNCFGPFIGIIIYQLLFDFSDLFQSYWTSFFVEILIMSFFAFGGIMLIEFLGKNISLFQTNEQENA